MTTSRHCVACCALAAWISPSSCTLNDPPDRAAGGALSLFAGTYARRAGAGIPAALRRTLPGFGHVMVGIIRAMADDYGALAFTNYVGAEGDDEVISITVARGFCRRAQFQLAQKVG